MMELSLRGRRVLVTGASGGFGSAITRALRARGASVVGLDRVGDDDVIECDIADADAVRTAVDRAVDRLGGLDALVNNAGIGLPSEAGETVDDGVRSTVEVNLLGTWKVTAAALPSLLDSGGRAVFVSSGLAFLTLPFGAAYSVTKRALSAYADSLRIEYGPRIGVSTVYPGYVRTPIHRAPEAAGVTLEGKVPAERVDDVVHTVLRTLTARRAPRDVGTTRSGGLVIRFARCLPFVADKLVRWRHERDLKAGKYDGVDLAKRMLRARSRRTRNDDRLVTR